MRPELLVALLIVLGIPGVAHCAIRDFWAASFLSATVAAVALGAFVHGLEVQPFTLATFVLGAFFLLLGPALLIGLAFNRSKRRIEYHQNLLASSAGRRRRLVFGIAGVAFGTLLGAWILARVQPGAADFPVKAFLGAIAFVGVGVWELAALYRQHKVAERKAT